MRSLRTIGLFLLGLSLVSCQNDSPSFQAYSLSGFTMGTTYSVKVVSALPVNTNALISDIDRRLTEINASMSTYLPDSELSRINQSRTSNWITLSDELFTVLKAANEVSDKSNGAFDITVGPLINLWGFGPAGKAGVIPTDREIKSVMEYTGYEKLLLDTERKALRKTHPNIYIDLSAIAKGYAVDSIASLLREKYGLENSLVEIGGELKGFGHNRHGRVWRIGIEKPAAGSRSVQKIVTLDDIGMATSGNYRNFYDLDGQRLSHTVDPSTGRPVEHILQSVTVFHESTMMADAWATAMLVMMPDNALELADREQLAIYLIKKTEAGFQEDMSSAFREAVQQMDQAAP